MPEVQFLLDQRTKALVAETQRFLANKGLLAQHFVALFGPEPEGFRGWAEDVALGLGIALAKAPPPKPEPIDLSEVAEIANRFGMRTPQAKEPVDAVSDTRLPEQSPPPDLHRFVREIVGAAFSEYMAPYMPTLQRIAQVAQSVPPAAAMPVPPIAVAPGHPPGSVAAPFNYVPPQARNPFAPLFGPGRPWA